MIFSVGKAYRKPGSIIKGENRHGAGQVIL